MNWIFQRFLPSSRLNIASRVPPMHKVPTLKVPISLDQSSLKINSGTLEFTVNAKLKSKVIIAKKGGIIHEEIIEKGECIIIVGDFLDDAFVIEIKPIDEAKRH